MEDRPCRDEIPVVFLVDQIDAHLRHLLHRLVDRRNLRHRQLRQKRVVIADNLHPVRNADAQLHCCLDGLRRDHIAAAEQTVNPLIPLQKFEDIRIVAGVNRPLRREVQLNRLDLLLSAGFQKPFLPGIRRQTDPGGSAQAANPSAPLCDQLLCRHPAALMVIAEDTGIARIKVPLIADKRKAKVVESLCPHRIGANDQPGNPVAPAGFDKFLLLVIDAIGTEQQDLVFLLVRCPFQTADQLCKIRMLDARHNESDCVALLLGQ